MYMSMVKCNYCGRDYDERYEGHLDNGSNCCPECEKEEAQKEKAKNEELA